MSNGDKRSVGTDALETLGMVHFKEEKRDAIHLAVEPMEAGVKLNPGESVIFKDGKAYPDLENKGLGIVDPFLRHAVRPGEKFWFVLRPRMVKSLRHVWDHPEFPEDR